MASYFGFNAYDVNRSSDPFVFISYKNEDSDRVAIYAKYLHDNGINVWYDNGLQAGSDWESYLMTIIEKPSCKAVLLFVSAKVADSTVIPLETTQARICKKPTVAVYLEAGLDIEKLLSKAIKVYVEQRQSVNAYMGTEDSICRNILRAARKAMENTADEGHKPNDELWANAQMFMRNFERSRNSEDIKAAQGYLDTMTHQSPADYRGWLGLAMCECLPRPESLDSGLSQLRNGAKYYSYVVSAGADDAASYEYTRIKSRLWHELLYIMEISSEECVDDESVQQLLDKSKLFEKHFGHTEAGIKDRFWLIVGGLNDVMDISVDVSAQAVADCEWKILSKSKVCLAKYNGTESYYTIPKEVDGRKVTRIGKRAFEHCAKLVCITIHDGVKKIGKNAFPANTDLTLCARGGLSSPVRKYARKHKMKFEKIK